MILCGPGRSVGVATELRAGRSGIECRWGRDFPPVQTGPGAHPASCKIYKYIMMYQSNTIKFNYVYSCIRICFDSYRIIFRSFWDTDPYWAMIKIWDVLYVYYCIGATCFDSYRIIFRPFWDTDPYWAMFKTWDVLYVYCNGATCFDSYRITLRPF